MEVWLYEGYHDAGLRGRRPSFIDGFLKNRKFHARIGTCTSDPVDQEMGVPQGSLLTVTLVLKSI